MIVTSKINNKKYQWIKIPRTGTVSYRFLFFPELQDKVFLHLHTKYGEHFTCDSCTVVEKFPGFCLVRNPISRFISSLKYIILMQEHVQSSTEDTHDTFKLCDVCGVVEKIPSQNTKKYNKQVVSFPKFWENETDFYDFLYGNFDKNCNLKLGITFENIFDVPNSSFIGSFFKTQISACYHPSVKIFKYENINEYNSWIETELGYDTSHLSKFNTSRISNDSINIDFTSSKFKELVKYLFHDDFKYLGYDI